jgi:DNA-binding SARP family transcriptional activator
VGRIEMGILGSLEVRVDGRLVHAGGPRQRALLTLLLLECGRSVRLEQLADRLWDGQPPQAAAGTVHAYVSRLRRVLGVDHATVLQSAQSGYRVVLTDENVDARWFELQVERGRALVEAGDNASAAKMLRAALDLWRGPVLADFAAEAWAQLTIVHLEEIRRSGEEAWADAELALGHHEALVPWLEQQVGQNPMRERTAAQLMIALYRSGRQTDALATYTKVRQELARELGIDPSPEIEGLHLAILRHDFSLSRNGSAPVCGISNLPPRDQGFHGRETTLRDMHEALTARPNILALHGMGGAGKTSLAVEYAYREAADYDIRWYVPAADHSALCHSFTELAAELDIPVSISCGKVVDAVVERLRTLDRWLLVLDDVEDEALVTGCLPTDLRGHIIVTSRSPVWARLAYKLVVEPFTRAESVGFLRHRLQTVESGTAERLAEELGDLPLALDQAAAFTEQTGMQPGEYLELFRRHTDELLHRGAQERTIATVWEFAFDAVDRTCPAARDLLYLCATLDAHVSLRLLREHPAALPPALAEVGEIGLEDAIALLLRHGLVQRDADRLRMHRLVRTAAFLRLGDDAVEWLAYAGRLLTAALGEPDDPATWPAWAETVSPLLALATRFERAQPPPPLPNLWCAGGVYLTARAMYGQAQRLLDLAVRQADHVDLANALSALGKLQEIMGDLAASQDSQVKAVRVLEGALGREHPKVGDSLRNLSSVLWCQRKIPDARVTLTRAIAILEPTGRFRELTACYRDLGYVEWAAGNLRTAESMFTTALTTVRRLGTGHPDVAHTLSGLAWVCQDTGDLDRACRLHEQSLAILSGVYGARHPEVAHCHDKLGYARQLQGDLAAAKTEHEQALSILQTCFGPDHGELGWPLTNLGLVHLMNGELAQAERCQRRAEDAFRSTFGPAHANTLIAARRLATVLLRTGAPAEARDLLRSVLELNEQALGLDHPDVGRTLARLSEAHQLLGEVTKAAACRDRALQILRRTYGPDHPAVTELSAAHATDRIGQR